jgi:hypothetical protein
MPAFAAKSRKSSSRPKKSHRPKSSLKKKRAVPAALRKYQLFMVKYKRPGKKAEVERWWASRGR